MNELDMSRLSLSSQSTKVDTVNAGTGDFSSITIMAYNNQTDDLLVGNAQPSFGPTPVVTGSKSDVTYSKTAVKSQAIKPAKQGISPERRSKSERGSKSSKSVESKCEMVGLDDIISQSVKLTIDRSINQPIKNTKSVPINSSSRDKQFGKANAGNKKSCNVAKNTQRYSDNQNIPGNTDKQLDTSDAVIDKENIDCNQVRGISALVSDGIKVMPTSVKDLDEVEHSSSTCSKEPIASGRTNNIAAAKITNDTITAAFKPILSDVSIERDFSTSTRKQAAAATETNQISATTIVESTAAKLKAPKAKVRIKPTAAKKKPAAVKNSESISDNTISAQALGQVSKSVSRKSKDCGIVSIVTYSACKSNECRTKSSATTETAGLNETAAATSNSTAAAAATSNSTTAAAAISNSTTAAAATAIGAANVTSARATAAVKAGTKAKAANVTTTKAITTIAKTVDKSTDTIRTATKAYVAKSTVVIESSTAAARPSAAAIKRTSYSGMRSKSQDLDSSQSRLMTDFYPIRRSSRTTASQIKKLEQDRLEKFVIENREDGLIMKQIPGKGRGVVAEREFQRGDFLLEYAGELIDYAVAKEREYFYSQDQRLGCYMYYFSHKDHRYCIDATAETPRLGRLLNHSKLKPNCATKILEIQGVPRLIFVALKKVAVGEELLYDYGDRDADTLGSHPWLAY